MKRLLLLLMLFPVIVFSQTRQRAIVDSIKAASTDLQRVSRLIDKYPGTKIESIQASDSDEYVTVTIRIRAGETIMPVFTRPVTEIGLEIATARLDTLAVPPFPFLFEKDTIIALALEEVLMLRTENSFEKMDLVSMPPMPPVIDGEPLELIPLITLHTDDVAFGNMVAVPMPPLPPILDDEPLTLFAIRKLQIEDIRSVSVDALTVPPLPNIKFEIPAIPFVAIALLPAEAIAARAATVDVPPVPEFEPDPEPVDVYAAIEFSVKIHIPTGKMNTVVVPVFEEKRMAVEGMHLSDEGYSLLEKMEGFSPDLYTLGDGGFTIGFGFFVPYGELNKWRDGVTMEDAERMIRQRVPAYEDQVKQYINVPLTQKEFDALTMLAYNLGSFSRASSIVNDVNGDADFDQLQHDWMKFVHSKAPGVLKGLKNRRRDELAVRNESDYQPERKIQIYRNRP